MSFDVRGKACLVTGANRGIGKAITESLLKHGAAKIYAAVRKPESAAALVEAYGDQVVPLEFDLTKPATIAAAAAAAGDTSLVINNAGVLRTATPFSDDAIEALTFEMEANVIGLIHVARAFAPLLKANGGGALVQLNSVVSLKCFPQFTTYCASKAAAYSVTQSLRVAAEGPGNRSAQCAPRTDRHRHG